MKSVWGGYMEPILIDTNLLVYVYDRRDPIRQNIAIRVVGSLSKVGIGRLSAQCLSEFFNAATKRKANQDAILSIAEAVSETEKLSRAFAIFPVTQQVVLEALRGVQQYHLQFWDAQIWAAARLNQIPYIFSEDFQIGAAFEGVNFVNPFVPSFQLQTWITA
jgi:predicted nucleic acid-binding protein